MPSVVGDLPGGVVDRPLLLVRPLVDEDVEHVGDVHQPADQRDVLPRQARGVALAVPALVVGARDVLRGLEQRRAALGEDPRADRGVRLDDLELLVGEPVGLEQDRVRDRDLAQVVQRRGAADQVDLVVGQPHPPAQAGGHRAHALGVLPRVVVAVLGGEGEPPQRVETRRVDVAVGLDACGPSTASRSRTRAQAVALEQRARRRTAPGAGGQARHLVDRDDGRARARPERVQAGPQRRPGRRQARRPSGGPARPPPPVLLDRRRAGDREPGAHRGGPGIGPPSTRAARTATRPRGHGLPVARSASSIIGMMPEQPPDPRLGTVVAGYRIDSRIGRGGMGVVYVAEHQTLRRQAALKIIVPDLAENPDFRERFLREARIAAALPHPNIVTVYDAGEIDGMLYIAMQFVPGATCRRSCATRGGSARTGRSTSAARSAPRSTRRTRRADPPRRQAGQRPDRRPSRLPDRLRADQGARGHETTLTRVGEVVGTTHYLAPEQVEGGDVDGRADIYALGCLLFHCLTGELPFVRDNDMAVLYAHLHDEPPKLTEKRPDCPKGSTP